MIITSSSLAEAAPINNVQDNQVPVNVPEIVEPIVKTEPVVEPVVVAQTAPKVTQPTIHPKGCENYRDLYTRVFGSKADVFLKIANKESSCNPMAVGDKHLTYWQGGIEYGMSCGLLQVRYLPGRPSCSQMQDPTANAQYALNLYNSGGFGHWSVCNKGLVSCY